MQRGPQRLLGSLPGHSGWRSRKSLALWCSRWSIPNLQTLLQTSGRSLPRSNLRKSLRSLPLHVTRIRYDMHIYFPPSSLFSIGPPKHVIMLFFWVWQVCQLTLFTYRPSRFHRRWTGGSDSQCASPLGGKALWQQPSDKTRSRCWCKKYQVPKCCIGKNPCHSNYPWGV